MRGLRSFSIYRFYLVSVWYKYNGAAYFCFGFVHGPTISVLACTHKMFGPCGFKFGPPRALARLVGEKNKCVVAGPARRQQRRPLSGACSCLGPRKWTAPRGAGGGSAASRHGRHGVLLRGICSRVRAAVGQQSLLKGSRCR
ncbi:hypothetical protein VPH35_060991 [Triticum aestivum]